VASDNEGHEALADLARRIEQHQAAGDGLAEADARAHKAQVLVSGGDWTAAADELGQAAALAFAAGDMRQQSRYLYTQALLLSRLPDQGERAKTLWRQAAGAAFVGGDLALEIKPLQRLAELALREQDWAGALGHLGRAIDRLAATRPEDADLQRQRVGLLRDRARLYQTQGLSQSNRIFLQRARDDLARAVDLARALDDAELALAARVELRVLESAMSGAGEGAGAPEPLAALRAEAEALGAQGILGSVALEQAAAALRADRPWIALDHAETARQQALDGPDPVRYLLACMLLAEARDALGDRPGVIAILLTCKQSLERLLGKEAGQPVTLVLDSLERRWGREGVEQALRAYRERMPSSPPT
jgi:hypothetical protein